MWDSVAPKEFGDTRVAGQLLVASISGVSEAAPYKDTLSERTRYRMPSESIAMEWQPWLQKQADTFALLPDDSTGGVWGFHQRDDSGTVVYDTADGCYRYRLETSKFTGQTLVLSDVECSDGFTRWETEAHPHFTTDTLYLAITLQRNDASPDTPENLDNPVLRLRVPKWWKWQCSPDSSLSKFRALPDTTGAIETVYSTFDGSYRGQRINADTTSTGPTEMVITRRMIPPINSSDKNITVYGMLVFDLKVDTNHIPADDNPDIWRNPRFVRNQRDNDNRTCIGRVSVDVTFCDELGVDIKWVRLESGSGRELFWGGFDKQICDSVAGFMARLRQYNHDSVAVPGEQPRLWRVYGRDEISPMHWKAFRYINRLLHDRVTTEWYVPDMSKARHCLRLKEYWSGETVALINNAPSPLIRHGVLNNNTNLDSLYLYAGFKKGRDDWRDFETRLEHWSKSCGNVTNRNYSNKPLPLPNDSIDFYCDSYETGVLGYVEQALKIGYANHPQLLFDTTITRYDNVWEYSSFRGLRKNVGDSLVLRLDKTTNARVKSAEEIRLQNWLPLILGSKGLFHYHGQTGALPEDVNDSKWGDIPKAGKANTIGADVGMVHQYPACLDVAALGDARIDNDSLGTDYLQDGDSSHYDKYLPHGIDTTALAMNAMAANPPGVPLFRKTMRQVVREVQRSIQPFTDSLLQMRLVAWRGQGFRHYFLGDTAAYKLWLHGDSAHQRVCIPAEQDVGTAIPRPRTEPYDSTFYDITIHSIGTAPIDQVCVIGVLNRRTDPRYDTTFGQDYVYTYDELKSRVRSNPPDLYKQYGARRLRLPFHYQGMSAQARNLRVQELRFADTTMMNMQPPIDTIIGRDVALDIDFLPGEGKFFRVSTVPASSQQGTGFLAHSNQRKIVAFPVIDSFITAVDTTYGDTVRTWRQMVPGDTMRYHRVFHRRRDSAETGALTVWYQRSQPLVLSDTLPASPALPAFDASVIEWEPPVNVSSRIMYAPPDVFPKIPQIMDLSCGFPALVVRVDTLEGNVSKVYIVFACEYKPADTVNGRVLVCETVLPADVPHQQQVDFVAGDYAVKLDEMRFYPIYPPVTPGNVLEHWGTPMINASQSGNYYCWSNSELSQIGVGFKQPHMREFLPGQTEYLRVTPGEYVATHPSMNSYSRLHIGEDDAGLIWQEGPNPVNGHDIYYTRLKHYPNNQIYHQLSADDPPVFQDPGMIVLDDNSVARVCGPQVPYNDLNYIATHSYPVLYRQMSDWNLTPSSGKYYDIGLINYKAERAYWQSTLTGNGRTVISRRMFDVAEWSSSVNGGIDTLGSKPVFIIFSTSFNLRGPDVAQGEQWWQWGSDPGYNAWDYDDSTSVLEFWSDTSTTDHFPKLWSMTMSWHLYGASGNHNLEHLVSVDSVRVLRDNGLYPHLAARYSMITIVAGSETAGSLTVLIIIRCGVITSVPR